MVIYKKIHYHQTVKSTQIIKPFSEPWGLIQQVHRHVNDKSIAGKRVLDIGCGDGWIEKMLLEKGAKRVDGIDISSEVIKKAKKRRLKKVTYQVGDAISIPFNKNTFDAVVAFEVLEHIPPHGEAKMFSEVFRVLKPGGDFFLSTPHKYWFAMLADPAWWLIGHRHYSLDNIRSYLNSSKLREKSLYVRGGIKTALLLLSMYFAKKVTHRSPLFYRYLIKGSNDSYEHDDGVMNVFLHAQKPKR